MKRALGQRSRLSPRARVGLMVVGFAIALASGLGQVAERRALVAIGYQLESASSAHRRHEEENRRLRLELSVLTNPARIQSLARELGMVQPGSADLRIMAHLGPPPTRTASAMAGERGAP